MPADGVDDWLMYKEQLWLLYSGGKLRVDHLETIVELAKAGQLDSALRISPKVLEASARGVL